MRFSYVGGCRDILPGGKRGGAELPPIFDPHRACSVRVTHVSRQVL